MGVVICDPDVIGVVGCMIIIILVGVVSICWSLGRLWSGCKCKTLSRLKDCQVAEACMVVWQQWVADLTS